MQELLSHFFRIKIPEITHYLEKYYMDNLVNKEFTII